ncbi:hypothetical protein BS47DRAFT_1331017 [Hydnum rufescens UP504]|uniref:tRNA-splicing endonuclease subunit Sen15 domain-containing protein n=1 Tax=Hydnum rufescens UP504 TaxID=1448309 RepID=A0A9P6ATE2_9AGAM|nr:hypothetical protein BS47DRAFT_1331017 [Hydnum rufescens UP504]
MEGHPCVRDPLLELCIAHHVSYKYNDLQTVCARYPKHAQSLFQTYNDMIYVQQWVDVNVVEIAELSRAIVTGRKAADEPMRIVVPCSLSENLSIKWLNDVFQNCSPIPNEIWIGIVGDDSSMVYYKLSKGIVKPPM